MDKNQRRTMEFWKGGQKENTETKHNKKKWRILKTGLLGTQEKNKKTLKFQENSIWGLFPSKKDKNTKKKTKPPKNKKTNKNNTFLHVGKQPVFWVNLCFSTRWKHYKNSVFSRAQLLCVTDSKTPFWGETLFCCVWWLCMVTKKAPCSHNG